MKIVETSKIEEAVCRLAIKACVNMRGDCQRALLAAREREEGAARFALDTLLENEEIARKSGMPICQDTGMACVLIELGQEVSLSGMPLADAVNEGVRRAYSEGNFRKSICDPLTRKNTGDNTPAHLHVEIVGGDKVRITFLPKGFGSENMSYLKMLTPAEGKRGIVDTIVEAVKKAGSRPCPPVVVGVGIGGSFDSCAYLAKKALTRPLESHHPREDVASIEREAIDKINALGIGPQGFGGKTSALAVLCEVAPTHIAGLPVAVNMQCHCVRCEEEVL